MKPLITAFLLLTVLTIKVFAQSKVQYVSNSQNLQWGVTLKGSVEFGFGKNASRPNPIFRLSADAGIGSNFIAKWFLPTLNQELQLYTGGFGSRSRTPSFSPRFTFDAITAITFTAGFSSNNFTRPNAILLADRDVPLYYFSNFARPALQNPYKWSLSVGDNFIFSSDKEKHCQIVGFTNAHVFDRFQVIYYNDGGGLDAIKLGDKGDRYHTGGGLLVYNGKRHTDFNLIEIGYAKFTGDAGDGFKLSNNMGLAYIDYHDPEQQMFNKGIVSITVANPSKGYGVDLRFNNYISLDAQNIIHYNNDNAFHLVPYPHYISVIASGYLLNNQIGLR